jgi:hypothetical protein
VLRYVYVEIPMKYSELFSEWCVHPTYHTNYIDVVQWCYDRHGTHSIIGKHAGTWSYGHGKFYGFTYEKWGLTLTDNRLYFSFKNKDDAKMFELAWA